MITGGRWRDELAAAPLGEEALPREDVKVLDARIDAYRNAAAPIADIEAAIEARAKAQADPAPYFTGAQILLDRGEHDRAIALAGRGRAASDRFVGENLSAYQMAGKSQGAYSRGRATAADLIGWAAYLKKEYDRAAASLGDAERLSRGQDFANQFHLGELARATNQSDRARQHYLDALALSAGGMRPLTRSRSAACSRSRVRPPRLPVTESSSSS